MFIIMYIIIIMSTSDILLGKTFLITKVGNQKLYGDYLMPVQNHKTHKKGMPVHNKGKYSLVHVRTCKLRGTPL